MSSRSCAFVLCLSLLLGWAGLADLYPPGYSAVGQYRFGVGARALALGRAFTAVAEGPEALYWNAAGLAWARTMAGGMYTEPFAGLGLGSSGMRVQYVGVTVPLRGLGFGIGWFNTYVGDIPYTDEGGTFSYDSSVYLGGVGLVQTGEGMVAAVGVTAKLYRESMLEGRAQGFGLDAGLILALDNWRLAYCSQDIGGTRYRWQGTDQGVLVEVPWVHRMGAAAYWFEGVLLTVAEVVLEMGGVPPVVRAGVEWRPVEAMSLRAGAEAGFLPEGSFQVVLTAGLGVAWANFLLDVAYIHTGLVADSLVFSVGVVF